MIVPEWKNKIKKHKRGEKNYSFDVLRVHFCGRRHDSRPDFPVRRGSSSFFFFLSLHFFTTLNFSVLHITAERCLSLLRNLRLFQMPSPMESYESATIVRVGNASWRCDMTRSINRQTSLRSSFFCRFIFWFFFYLFFFCFVTATLPSSSPYGIFKKKFHFCLCVH